MTDHEVAVSDKFVRIRRIYKTRGKQLDQINRAAPWHCLYREATIRKLRATLPDYPCHILDAGGGTGIFARLLAADNHSIVLVDALKEMLAFATELTHSENLDDRVRGVGGDFGSLPFRDGAFDVVLCTQVLNFCPSLRAPFSEFARVLRPGGILFADVDTKYRWCVIEAIKGHIDNALAIARHGVDEERRILWGADYHFFSRSEVAASLHAASCDLADAWGVEFVAPYLYILAESQEFLQPERLPAAAQVFTSPAALDKLRRLEAELESKLPPEAAGWFQFLAVKRGGTPNHSNGGAGEV
jgi:ubiquinone/menaquinone biosynthesis C-methylase UbiE